MEPTMMELFKDVKFSITSSPLLPQYNPVKPTFIKIDWSVEGIGYILMQPADNELSVTVTKSLQAGGPCLFSVSKSGSRLLPICFGSRECTGLEKKYHSFAGEAATGH